MVSLNTILGLGAVAIAVVSFIGLGGAKGIGQKLGSGISGGFTDFFSSFSGGLLNFASANQGGQQTETTAPTELSGVPPPIGLPQLQDNLTQTQSGLQSINDFFSNFFSGALFNPGAFKTSLAFTPSAISKRIGFQSINKGIVRTNFGGFGGGIAQENALQQAILESQRDNPSFFLRG